MCCSMWRPSFTQILRRTHPCYPASSKSIKSPSLPLSFCLSPKVIAPAGRKPMTISSYMDPWRFNVKVSVEAPKLAPKPTFEAIQVTHRLISSYAPVGCGGSRWVGNRGPSLHSVMIHCHLLQLYISSLFIWKCHQYLNKTLTKTRWKIQHNDGTPKGKYPFTPYQLLHPPPAAIHPEPPLAAL